MFFFSVHVLEKHVYWVSSLIQLSSLSVLLLLVDRQSVLLLCSFLDLSWFSSDVSSSQPGSSFCLSVSFSYRRVLGAFEDKALSERCPGSPSAMRPEKSSAFFQRLLVVSSG